MEKTSPRHSYQVTLFVGPSGIGKTAIINRLAGNHPDEYHKVQSVTTRPWRSDDKRGAYRYLSRISAQKMIQNDQFMQYAVHPESHEIYGTLVNDYDHEKMNLIDVMSGAVTDFTALDFGSLAVVGVVATKDEWLRRMKVRYPASNKESSGRYREGMTCLRWIHQHADYEIDTTNIDNDVASRRVYEELKTKL